MGGGIYVDADHGRHSCAHGAIGIGPDQIAAYNGANYGWNKMLGGLERVLGEVN